MSGELALFVWSLHDRTVHLWWLEVLFLSLSDVKAHGEETEQEDDLLEKSSSVSCCMVCVRSF